MSRVIILDKAEELSLEIIKIYRFMINKDREYVISKQLLRSGTSIGANLFEAQDAISKKEFLVKVNISLKEANESLYWIRIIRRSNLSKYEEIDNLEKKMNIVKANLVNIVKTTKRNLDRGV